MQVSLLLWVLAALLCASLTRADSHSSKSSVIADLLPKSNQEVKERQSRFLRRVFPNVYLHTPLGRVASDMNDFEDYDMEELERAVRKQQRVRRRKVLAVGQTLKTRHNGSKKNTQKSSKKGNRKTKRKNTKRRKTKGKRSKKSKKPVKKVAIRPFADDALSNDHVKNDDVFDEEIHKLQREPGQPISVMIVEQDF